MSSALQPFKEHFHELVQRKQVVHAYLFTGNDQEGKEELVMYLAQALAEEAGDATLAERIKERQTADILYVQPEGRFIRVEQIRQLKSWLATSPVELPYKMAVIQEAEAMNASSANALLKVLEEPFERVYIILWSTAADQLLPTIQSRVQEIYLQTEDPIRQVDVLLEEGVSQPHAKILADLRAEKPEQYEEAAFSEELKAYNNFYGQLLAGEAQAYISVQTRLKAYLTSSGSLLACDYLLYLNYALLRNLEPGERQPVDFQSYYLKQLQEQLPVDVETLLGINEALYRVKERLQANVSPQVAFEGLVLDVLF